MVETGYEVQGVAMAIAGDDAQRALGDNAETVWAEGRTLPFDQAVGIALAPRDEQSRTGA